MQNSEQFSKEKDFTRFLYSLIFPVVELGCHFYPAMLALFGHLMSGKYVGKSFLKKRNIFLCIEVASALFQGRTFSCLQSLPDHHRKLTVCDGCFQVVVENFWQVFFKPRYVHWQSICQRMIRLKRLHFAKIPDISLTHSFLCFSMAELIKGLPLTAFTLLPILRI